MIYNFSNIIPELDSSNAKRRTYVKTYAFLSNLKKIFFATEKILDTKIFSSWGFISKFSEQKALVVTIVEVTVILKICIQGLKNYEII